METAAATLAANERSSGQEAEVGAPNQSAGATNELSEEQQQQTNVLEATATTAEELNIMAKEMNEMTDVVEEQKLYIVEEEEQQQKSNNNEATVDIIAKPSDEAGVDATPNAKLLDDGEGSEQREQNMDEIPEQIKVLDDIISEFDAETTKPAALHNNSGENQSEDDGYMSLSRKNMSKKDSEDVPQTPSTDTVPEGSFNEVDASCGNGTAENLAKLESEAEGGVGEQQLIQTTLPKARAANTTPAAATNYSSLPCCGARNTAANTAAVNALNMCATAGGGVGGVGIVGGGLITAKARTGSCNAERNALGIDISAVHNAVLRGNLAKLPEPMLNEHPVTIYPGPSTKSGAEGGARNKRHQLINSVEQHKEVCHMLNPHGTTSSSSTTTSGSSASNTTTTTSSSSSGEASPAASNLNVSAKATKKLPEQTATANAVEDVYSADSLEEEESTISTDITPVKQNGIAWEITFKNSNKKKQLKSKSGAKSHAAKKTQRQTDVCLDYNAMYNQSNMLGKGTFVIRRSAAKKPPRAVDIFGAPNVPSPPPPLPSTSTDVIYTSDSELSETSLPPPPPPAPQAAVVSPHSGEANFIYKECEASAAATRRGLEMAAQQRAALAPSPRERLSLNIESAHQSREACVKLLTHSGNSPEEQHNKFSKKCILNLSEKRLSAESMPDNTSSSEEFDEARLNGNGFELFPYNANGIKPPEYEHRTSATTTPHTDLAPTLEEDEELSDFSYGCAPLKQIENNISALLRGDMPLARIVPPTAPNIVPSSTSSNATAAAAAAAAAAATELAKRPLEFRPGVHKSESAKEMLLSQNAFGPLPPSPPSSNPDLFDYDAPLPPSPVELKAAAAAAAATNVTAVAAGGDYIKQTSAAPPIASYKQTNTTVVEVHATASGAAAIVVPPPPPPVVSKLDSSRRSRDNVSALRHFNDELPPPPAPAHKTSFEVLPPAVPPHRGHSVNSMKSWSIDSNYRKKSPKMLGHYSGAGGGSGITTPTGIGGPPMTPLPPPPLGATAQSAGSYESGSYTRRYVNYGTKRSLKQSPREEHRLQTSCSLPETPIFARGCDIPRTPYRRQNEPPAVSGSRTAPRSSTSNSINMGTSIVGIGAGNYGTSQMCRQRSINHALASNEMLRMTGAPARGWYPKQRSLRPVSTENIDRLASVRVWDNPAGMSGTGQSRKPLTLPPNLTPSFLHKSPREALRRVTSLLITKKKNTKERKHKAYSDHSMDVGDKHAYEFETGSSKRKESTRNTNGGTNTNTKKKKGLFKTLWKRTKHVSLDQ